MEQPRNNSIIWKTITTKNPTNLTQLFCDIKTKNIVIGKWAYEILTSPTFKLANGREQIPLVIISVKQLLLEDCASLKGIYNQAFTKGLHLCSLEVGLNIIIEYADQFPFDRLNIAMLPFVDKDGDKGIFTLRNLQGKLILNVSAGCSDQLWFGDDRFVFCG